MFLRRVNRVKSSSEIDTSGEEVTVLMNTDFRLNTRLEKVLDGNLQIPGRDLVRIPGTDANDDDHILSPFTKRKGNATNNANPQVSQSVSQSASYYI